MSTAGGDYSDDYSHLADIDHNFKVIPDVVKGRVLHIDGDFLPYQCAGDDDTPFPVARNNMFSRIENIRAMAGADRAVVHITSPLSDKARRFDIAVTKVYQGNRTHAQRAKNWAGLCEVLQTKSLTDLDYVQWDDREADDALTAAQWNAQRGGYSDLCVITSNDKDLRQVKGLYLDWKTSELQDRPNKHYYSEYQLRPESFALSSTLKEGSLFHGVWFLLWQMLHGDKTDNIPALSSINGTWLLQNLPEVCSAKALAGKEAPKDKPVGPALAAKILGAIPSNLPSQGYEVVKELYREHYKDNYVDYFKEQWQLLGLYYSDNDDRLALARAIRDGEFDE